jgi:hypothetical protein
MVRIYLQKYEQCSGEGHEARRVRSIDVESTALEEAVSAYWDVVAADLVHEHGLCCPERSVGVEKVPR